MEFTTATDYDMKTLTAMAKALRKTVRKRKSRRAHIFGWIVVLLGTLLLLPPAGSSFSISGKTLLTLAAVLAILLTFIFEDRLNGYFARKRLLPGTESAVSVFMVTSGGLGTMGFGLPAAIGAKLGAPDREVVLFAGDGGLQMTIQELGTIFQSKIPVKIVLLNNSFLGMVRQWQELFYDRRYSFTEMVNPDFGLIARGNGLSYRCVERRVEGEENIFPMVPAGAPVSEIRFE